MKIPLWTEVGLCEGRRKARVAGSGKVKNKGELSGRAHVCGAWWAHRFAFLLAVSGSHWEVLPWGVNEGLQRLKICWMLGGEQSE